MNAQAADPLSPLHLEMRIFLSRTEQGAELDG